MGYGFGFSCYCLYVFDEHSAFSGLISLSVRQLGLLDFPWPLAFSNKTREVGVLCGYLYHWKALCLSFMIFS